MSCGQIPLYPSMDCDCGRESCVRMPLFRKGPCCAQECCGSCKTVRLENPCCPGEYAEIRFSVDECGNLEICVHRDPPKRCEPVKYPDNMGCWDPWPLKKYGSSKRCHR